MSSSDCYSFFKEMQIIVCSRKVMKNLKIKTGFIKAKELIMKPVFFIMQ